MTDPSKRPLQFPHWHIPYLEKHRIFELFSELVRELVIRQPDDHVLFIKQILQNASKARDIPRIILLGSPKVNIDNIGREFAKTCNMLLITERTILRFIGKQNNTSVIKEETLATALSFIVRTKNAYNTGWVMVNCIKTPEEAKALLSKGILPTHIIQFIAPFHPALDDLLYCQVPENWPEYRRNITELRRIFHKNLREVYLKDKTLSDIVNECIGISKNRKAEKYVKPRVVILGPRGSGRKSQAKILSEVMGLVHVDFEYLLCQVWQSKTELSMRLRQCKKNVCDHSDLLAEVLNQRILQSDCLTHGWVLTGFPFCVSDFKQIDNLETSPNRVIFLECDLNVCRERLKYRKINALTGSVTYLDFQPSFIEEKILKTHPKDELQYIDAELNYYCQNYGHLRRYCGDTAIAINGDQNERWIHECISAFILGKNPPSSPRKGLNNDDDSKSSDTCACPDIPDRASDAFHVVV